MCLKLFICLGATNGEVSDAVGLEKVKKTNVIQTLSFYLGQMEQPQRKVKKVLEFTKRRSKRWVPDCVISLF